MIFHQLRSGRYECPACRSAVESTDVVAHATTHPLMPGEAIATLGGVGHTDTVTFMGNGSQAHASSADTKRPYTGSDAWLA